MRTRDEFLSPATNVYPYLPRIVIASEAKKCEKKKKDASGGAPSPVEGGRCLERRVRRQVAASPQHYTEGIQYTGC